MFELCEMSCWGINLWQVMSSKIVLSIKFILHELSTASNHGLSRIPWRLVFARDGPECEILLILPNRVEINVGQKPSPMHSRFIIAEFVRIASIYARFKEIRADGH